jgi:hypothetical protein
MGNRPIQPPIQWNWRLDGPQSWSGHFGEERNVLSMPGIEEVNVLSMPGIEQMNVLSIPGIVSLFLAFSPVPILTELSHI